VINLKKVLLTGASGFVGRNIAPILRENTELFTPTRSELDLRDPKAVESYLNKKNFDVILHCANPNPVKNSLDSSEKMVEDSLRIFMHLYNCRQSFGKMLYLGSGAEYNKTGNICSITEEHCFDSIPPDGYGFAKFTMNSLAAAAENVINMCLFACYGPTDHESKFITHCINCCMRNEPITIRRDCWFDYLHVYDLGAAALWHIQNENKFKMYNTCSGKRILLSEIAKEVNAQMGGKQNVIIINEGLANEYTASNKRFVNESGVEPEISIEQGIELQIFSERKNSK
jgi:nucleoside-diphosphate-sugar epimerase